MKKDWVKLLTAKSNLLFLYNSNIVNYHGKYLFYYINYDLAN